jgi:hypothetical protein
LVVLVAQQEDQAPLLAVLVVVKVAVLHLEPHLQELLVKVMLVERLLLSRAVIQRVGVADLVQ